MTKKFKGLTRIITIFFILVQILSVPTIIIFTDTEIHAVESDLVGVDMNPIISSSMIDITDSITVIYENINVIDFNVDYNCNGIEATVTEDEDFMQFEISAIDGAEFGVFVINAIANDGTILNNTLYTYNNGEKLYISEFGKDQALYQGLKDIYDLNDTNNTLITEEECVSKYADFTSEYIEPCGIIEWINDALTTTVKGNISWETQGTPLYGETENPTLPLRNALVQIGTKALDIFVPVGSGYTDSNGDYNVEIHRALILTGQDLYIRIKLQSHTILVATDWFFDHYFYDEILTDEDLTSERTIKRDYKIKYSNDTLLYKATYVHQGMVIGERFAKEMGFETSRTVRVAYPGGVLEGDIDEDLENNAFCGGNAFDSSYSAVGIKQYNNIDTLVHEYSHFVQISKGNYDATLVDILLYDPNHRIEDDQYSEKGNKKFAMHLVWTESWSSVFSAMAQKYYQGQYNNMQNYNANLCVNDYLSVNGGHKGEFQEAAVGSFLWSLFSPNVSINKYNFTFPLTYQEWWDITTAQGIYRLSDFIGFIENESYNLEAEIDYQSAKEYIATKLTNYNISPEISSIYIDPSDSNVPPTITLVMNGSATYPNNRLVIKIYDNNDELLGETSVISISKGNLETFGVAIPQNVWNEVKSQTQCYHTEEITLKICVQGYRYDNIDNAYATSGPYYSSYSCINVDFYDNYEYETFDETHHLYVCNNCGSEISKLHKYQYTSIDATTHSATCIDCGYSVSSVSHNFGYRGYSSTHHEKYCIDCGYVDCTERHSFRVDGAVGNYNRCIACGAMIFVGGDDLFPIQTIPPKDPEEETE